MNNSDKASSDKDLSCISIASNNNELKNKITYILDNLETMEIIDLENQIASMLQNMMNYFAKYVDDITDFDSLTPQQKKLLIMRFKGVAHSLSKHKVKSVNEMIQVFVFAVLNNISIAAKDTKDLSGREFTDQKHKHQFKEYLKKTIDYEIYKDTNLDNLVNSNDEQNIVSNSVLDGVKKALKYAGLEHAIDKINPNALKVLDREHQATKTTSKAINLRI